MIRDLNTKPFACKANALPIELIILITHPLDSLHICFADVKLWNYILDYLKDQVTIRRRHYLIITPPRISQRSYDDSDGIFVPYLLREVRRFERPKKSNLPRTALYLAPGTSFAFPPRTKTTECFCKLCPSPGI